MTIDEMKSKLEKTLTLRRFIHSVNVKETAVKLATVYDENKSKAAIAGLLHDCARDMDKQEVFKLCDRFNIKVEGIARMQPELLHGPIGSVLANREYGITDREILDAIRCHTTGRENMTLLDKIIFIADYIEPGRKFEGVEEVRNLAFRDLDKSIVLALDQSLKYIIKKGKLIHLDTVNARNSIIAKSIYKIS